LRENEVKVWDPLVRVVHWTLMAAFFVAYFTEEDLLDLHVSAGYVAAAVVAVRVTWGFVGPEHARFASFVYRPRAIVDYLRDLIGFRARRYLGHSPAGGAMVVVLLAAIAATTLTGMMSLAVDRNQGPFASWLGGNGAGRGGVLGDLHSSLAGITLGLVVLHILGVVLAGLVHRENLVRAMITGRKAADAGSDRAGDGNPS
jgi:cytochrome b